jgi:NAD(P)-dependent dehydrogenase (short-subunit alcohol dehydrogenase family)
MGSQVAVVTGAASGIGCSVTLRFLAAGAQVVAGDINPVRLRELAELAEARGTAGNLVTRTADVTDEAHVAGLVGSAVEAFGDFHGIVNNAGLPGAVGAIFDLRSEDWDKTMSVLLRGTFFGIKHAARQLIELAHGGWVVNIASVAGVGAGAGPIAYSSAKAAVINMTRACALELAGHRIRVNAVSPGMIVTPLTAPDAQRARADFARLQPWPEAGEPDDVAGSVLFLAGPDSRFMTGHNLVVDGGASIDIGLSARLRGGAAAPVPAGFNGGTSAGWVNGEVSGERAE